MSEIMTTPVFRNVPAQLPIDKLLDALSQGWHIQSPVYYRQRWYSADGNRLGYYFILKKDDDTDLIIVPDGDKVRQLIELKRLKVIVA